ncbi:DUF2206 domain-containing protein [Streptomyces gilvus]|uniref:DUF2206 domain-containing protein n=1 Tax=Streptomyces gilvus TaxID=2920937 RepID=UPI001F10F9C1|nr:DUF2206 domain-containing protein [Streptomyces sp. CME 23]MCH5673547.1 DUF2206 domain-containing protein [Streptomyces sp. CME 23]
MSRRRGLVLLLATALAALLEVLPGTPVFLLTPAGLWLLVGGPTAVWYASGVAGRAASTRDGQLLIALGLAVGGAIAVPLVVNTLLPWAGVSRPLERLPLALGALVHMTGLTVVTGRLWRPSPVLGTPSEGPAARQRPALHANLHGLGTVLPLGLGVIALCVAGPVRLNNGLTGTVAVAGLLAVAALLVLLLVRRGRYGAAVLELGLFFAAAGILLLTSLRGWYITGHDIQREYEVFRLAADNAHWDISAFPDPYNACLSIVLLPTALTRLTGIPGTYVFKVLLPLLFALTPVLVYRSVRNVAPQIIALLSAVYLMLFPTFFTDMTFLGRQEVAFFFLGCAMVVVTDSGRPLAGRRVMFIVMVAGIVLSHYSTTYVIVAVLGLALGTDLIWRLWGRLRRARPAGRSFVTWWMVAASALAAFVWSGPVTHTTGQLHSTLSITVRELVGGAPEDTASSDVSYSLFSGATVSAEQRLKDYRADTIRQTRAGRAAGDYLPLSTIDKYPVRVVAEQPNLPLTSAGRLLEKAGIDVRAANGLVRASAARLLQVLLMVGLATAVIRRRVRGRRARPGFRPSRDQVTLSIGMIAIIGLLTVLPQLSVDYGVLRAFQQGLFFFAPFVAAGSLWLFRWSGRWAVPAASALALGLLLDLTGVVPKLLGGYPAQLHLANTGQYYDIYYVHPEERSAIRWVQTRATDAQRADVQSEVQTDRYTFSRLQTLIRGRAQNDIFPALVGSHSYVFLGTTTVTKDQATTFYRGDLVTYLYPTELLDATKNKLYSNGGAEIYR